MKTSWGFQRGGSAFGNIVILLLVAYGIYVGINYVPIFIESRTVDSILMNIYQANESAQVRSMQEARTLIDKELTVNGMTHMRNDFEVQRFGGGYEVQVKYERKLNVLYEEKTLKFEKMVELN